MGTDHGLGIEVIQDRLTDFRQICIEVISEIHDKNDRLFVHRHDHLRLRIREEILQDLEALDSVILADTYDEYDTARRERDLILSGLQRDITRKFILEKHILNERLSLDIGVSLTHRRLDPLSHQFQIRSRYGIRAADESDVLGRVADHDLHIGLTGRAREEFIGKKNRSGTGILYTFPGGIGAGHDHTRCIHDTNCQVQDLLRFAHTFL